MKKLTKTINSISLSTLLISLSTKSASAQITNPAISGPKGNDAAAAASGATFASYFVYLWNALLVVGGLVTVVFFLQGALEWISAGGDSAKLQEARSRMINAAIGIFILVSMYTIINFISSLFFGTDFSLLVFTVPAPT